MAKSANEHKKSTKPSNSGDHIPLQEKAAIVSAPLTPTEVVEDALTNAELLLMHASETGLEIDPEEVAILTEAKRAFQEKQWNTDIELKFWLVYKNLARRSYPVTVDAVKAAQETKIKHPNLWQKITKKTRKNTLTYKAVRFYTILTIITLIIMVILHIIFAIGTSRLNRIQMANERMKQIEEQLDQIDLIIGNDMGNMSAELQKEKLMNELYEANSEKINAIKLLESWLRTIKKLTFSERSFEQRLSELQQEQSSPSGLPSPPTLPEASIDTHIGIIQEAQNYVLILGLNILPLFYGLLGALAFVLRDLAQATKKLQFTKETNITYTLRLMLGTIAGLAVGVFWVDIKQQQDIVLIKSLGPLLAAFLAGFMVEYVFTVLERWLTLLLEKAVGERKKVKGDTAAC